MAIDKSFLRDRFLAIDVRTLGIARIYIALLLLFDLAKRGASLSVWYLESGLLPNALLTEHPLRPWGYSFLFYVSSDGGVRAAFLLIALVYLGLLFGIFTRVFQVLSLVCLISLQIRIDLLSNGGDFVLCNLLVWTAFLPLGAAFSFDAWRKKKAGESEPSPVFSWAAPVVMLQLAVIYYFNAVHKTGETWTDGSAVYWLAHQERIVTGFGFWMREHLPFWMFRVLTYTSLVIEYLLPILILSPWGRPWTRRAAIVGIWALHLGIAAVANLGLFSFVMIGYSMLLISTEDWQWLRDRLAERRGEGDLIVTALTVDKRSEASRRRRSPLRWVALAILAYLFVVAVSQVLVENAAVPRFLKHQQPAWIQATVMIFRLNQGWSMFARDAPRDDMWIVVDAVTVDGRHVDPFNQMASRYADPELRTIPPRLGQSYYTCDYVARIKGQVRYHQGLVDWLFAYHRRTGNPDDEIVSFRAYEVSQSSPSPAEDEPRNVTARVFLGRQR
ncbi:MAG: HTTM domain-containing protein [Polyangiales bacterium]